MLPLLRDLPEDESAVSARDRIPDVLPGAPTHPPRFVHDERGEVVEVILSLEDYRAFLRLLAAHMDWDTLPPYLQDAIDRLLVEEAKAEALPPRPLRDLLSETGETP
jgi:hypothetical protein